MTRVRLSILMTALCLVALAPHATAGSYGTELPFVAGTSARASGMGLGVTSVPGTPSMHYYNPALLVGYDHKQFEFYRTTLFDSDSRYHAVSYVHPTLDWGTFGLTVLRLDVGGIEERDEGNNLLSDDLNHSQTRMLIGYGAQFHPSLSAGANFKIDRQDFGDVNGSGIGFDAGLLFRRDISQFATLEQMRAGLAIENLIEPSVKLDQEDVPDPMRLAFGVSADGRYRGLGFTTALDVVNPRTSPARARFGQEVRYAPYLAFRFGFDGSTPTFGVGASYQSVSLDYAYRDEDLGTNHRVSLSIAFGSSRRERLDERRARRDADLQSRVRRTVDELESGQLRSLLAKADSLFAANAFDRALDQYELVLVWAPSSQHAKDQIELCRRNARIEEALALMDRGEYLDALHRLRQALQLTPGDAGLNDLIDVCEQKIDEAEDRSRQVAGLVSTSIDLYAQERYPEALAGFQEVLRLDPENAIAREYELKSRENIESAIARHRQRARTLAARKDLEGARAELRLALALRPADRSIRAELADLEERVARGTPSPRTTPAPTRPALRPDERAALDRDFSAGVKHLEEGRFGTAAETLLRVWTIAPDYRNVAEPLTKSYLFMGMQLYSQSRYEEAITIWEKILTIDPGNVKARRYLDKSRQEADRLSGGSK